MCVHKLGPTPFQKKKKITDVEPASVIRRQNFENPTAPYEDRQEKCRVIQLLTSSVCK